jgi:hypothetical protein
MSYKRDCVPVGQVVTLQAIFVDACNKPVDLDTDTLTLEIYNSSGTLVTTIASASITNITTGFYEYSYTVPSDATEGLWKDKWSGQIGGVDISNEFTFKIMETGSIKLQTVNGNTLIVILLSKTIADTDGNALGEEKQLTFSTRYSPYYASPDLVRLECGNWLNGIPDDTLSLMIHWASKEADVYRKRSIKNRDIFETARLKFVVYDVALRCLMLPVNGSGGTKQLGDLLIKNNMDFGKAIKDIRDKREEWLRVLNSGGSIVPGQGFAPSIAIKGQYHPENKKMGRLWWSPDEFPYNQPAGNKSFRKGTQRKFRKGYSDLSIRSVYFKDEEPD